MQRVPPSPADRRLLILTGSFVALAGVLVAGILFLATQQGTSTGPRKPLFLGLERPLTKSIRDASPLYFANPFGRDGFWLDVEDGKLVALVLQPPGVAHCPVKWKAQQNAYVDCDGRRYQSRDLDHYLVTVGSRFGSPKDAVFVDLRKRFPAPASATTTTT
jgi:hypothetical protein